MQYFAYIIANISIKCNILRIIYKFVLKIIEYIKYAYAVKLISLISLNHIRAIMEVIVIGEAALIVEL